MILHGSITISRRIREHPIWQRQDYGWAWIDMLLLANNRDGTKHLNGEFIDVKRGQLLWSLRSLEKEWNKSGEWLGAFLQFCKEHVMVKVDSNRRRTIITILNYEAYNPRETDSEAGTVTDTETDTETDSEAGTVTEQNGEVRKENKKGERATPHENLENGGFAEVPAEFEVLAFASAYPGDIARGIPAGIPDRWAADWFRYKVGSGQWQKKWREKMVADFQSDWVKGHPKARGQKNGGVQTAGRSPAQARFELSRELEEVQARLDACHEMDAAPKPADTAREKELLKMISELPK